MAQVSKNFNNTWNTYLYITLFYISTIYIYAILPEESDNTFGSSPCISSYVWVISLSVVIGIFEAEHCFEAEELSLLIVNCSSSPCSRWNNLYSTRYQTSSYHQVTSLNKCKRHKLQFSFCNQMLYSVLRWKLQVNISGWPNSYLDTTMLNNNSVYIGAYTSLYFKKDSMMFFKW